MSDEVAVKVAQLDKEVAVIVVRIEGHERGIDELRENHQYMTRLIITTLISVLLGVALGVFGVVLAL